ncbi:hypothetical protein T265_13457, partial [Opisthorchis viverrini]
GVSTKLPTESNVNVLTTSVDQNHRHSTDASTANFEENSSSPSGVEGGENDSTVIPFQSIQSSEVHTNLTTVSGVTDHVTSDLNQDFTATVKYDDSTASQTTLGFTENVSETGWRDIHTHTTDATTGNVNDNASTETETDGVSTKLPTESNVNVLTTSVDQNHRHSTDASTANFEENSSSPSGVEGGENDSTVIPFQSIQSSEVHTNLTTVSGVTDHVTSDLNQDFTATVKYDDSTASQTTLGFTENVSETGWRDIHTHTTDATTGNVNDNASTETETDGVSTKLPTESNVNVLTTSVDQNHRHSTDASTANFEENSSKRSGVEGGENDSTVIPFQSIQSSEVHTNFGIWSGVTDHVTSDLNQDFTATVKYDDSTASQTTLGFTENVSETGWRDIHTHTTDATTGNVNDNASTETETDGVSTKLPTESNVNVLTTSVDQNHRHSTDDGKANFEENSSSPSGVEGGENDSTVIPFQSIFRSEVHTNLTTVSGVTDHVTSDLNQDFTATVKYDDSTASQTTLGFTKIVSKNGWDGTHTHAPDATSGNFYYNVSTEAKSGSSEDTTAKYSSTIPVSSTVHSNTGDGGESRISTAEYTDKGTGTGQQSTSSYSNTTYSGPDDNLTNQASTSNYTQ